MLLPNIYFTPVVLWCIFPVTSENITFKSSPGIGIDQNSIRFLCPNEDVHYSCKGNGNEIDVYAPPYVNSSSPLSFTRGDKIGAGSVGGPISMSLVSTDPPFMEASVQVVTMPSLSVFNITCEVRSPFQSKQVQHQLSDPPSNVMSASITPIGRYENNKFGSVKVNWTPPALENFNLGFYLVSLVGENETVVTIRTREMRFMVPLDTSIRARIVVVNRCGIESSGYVTGNVTISASPVSPDIPEWSIALITISAFGFIALIILIITCIMCCFCSNENSKVDASMMEMPVSMKEVGNGYASKEV